MGQDPFRHWWTADPAPQVVPTLVDESAAGPDPVQKNSDTRNHGWLC